MRILKNCISCGYAFGSATCCNMNGATNNVINIPATASCKLMRIDCAKMVLKALVLSPPAYLENSDCSPLFNPLPATANIK